MDMLLPMQCMEKNIYNTQVNYRFYGGCCLKSSPRIHDPLPKKNPIIFDHQQVMWFPTGVTTKLKLLLACENSNWQCLL